MYLEAICGRKQNLCQARGCTLRLWSEYCLSTLHLATYKAPFAKHLYVSLTQPLAWCLIWMLLCSGMTRMLTCLDYVAKSHMLQALFCHLHKEEKHILSAYFMPQW